LPKRLLAWVAERVAEAAAVSAPVAAVRASRALPGVAAASAWVAARLDRDLVAVVASIAAADMAVAVIIGITEAAADSFRAPWPVP
jgi:hypothetical protein